jgi:hypothetical protein
MHRIDVSGPPPVDATTFTQEKGGVDVSLENAKGKAGTGSNTTAPRLIPETRKELCGDSSGRD